jgi:Protein of unknown function (DUF2934)
MSDHVSSHPLGGSSSLQTLPATVSHLIEIRAYELYERRFKRDGHAVDDWLQAESEILNRWPRNGPEQFGDSPATAPPMPFRWER